MSMIAAYTKHACRHSLLRPGLRLAQKAAFATSATRKTGDDKRTQHGVVRALQDGSQTPSPTLLESEFSLADRVALVTGANRGLGLEGALALVEAGARAVYCVDVAETPGPDWSRVREYVSRMRGKRGEGRLEYIRGDVADQEQMWKIGKTVGDREGRMDVCLAAAGIVANSQDSLRIPDEHLQKVLSVNVKGVLYTAQAAGQQMERFGNGGSMIFIASVAGHVTVNLGITPYEVAKTSAKAENAGERARAAAIAASADEHNLRERSQPRCEIAAMVSDWGSRAGTRLQQRGETKKYAGIPGMRAPAGTRQAYGTGIQTGHFD